MGRSGKYPHNKYTHTNSYSERVGFAAPVVSHVKLPPTTLTVSSSPGEGGREGRREREE